MSVQDPIDDLIAARRKALAAPSGGDNLDSLIAARRQALTAPDKPSVFSRAMDNIGSSVSHALEHPIDTIESAVVAPIKSAFTAAVAPGVGEARPDARLSKGGNSSGRAIDTSPYDAAHGGVTSKERTAAGVQTVANIATPAAFGPLAGKVGKTAALAVTGAAEGAAYNPDDPGAGAIAGGIMAPVVGNVARGTAKAVDATRQVVGTTRRIRAAAPLDAAAIARTKATEAADRANYGAADQEAATNGGTSPALADALDHPRIKPFVDMVRASDAGAGASDAQLASEAYKLISRQRRGLQKKLAVEYDAKADLDARDLLNAARTLKSATAAASEKPAVTMDVAPEVFETNPRVTPGREPMAGPINPGLARDVTSAPNPTLSQALRNFTGNRENAVQGPQGPAFQLRGQSEQVTPGVRIETPGMKVQTAPAEAVPPVMPSFPGAVAEHARMKGERAAFNTGADATKRIMRGTSIAANKLDENSPAGFLDKILGYEPGDALAALEGSLGRAKEESAFKAGNTLWNTITAAGKPIKSVRRIAPFIDALDKQAGNPTFSPIDLEEALKYLGVAAAPDAHRQP